MERLIDTATAARRLHVSRRTVVRFVKLGYLPASPRPDRGWLKIPASAVEGLIRGGQNPTREPRP